MQVVGGFVSFLEYVVVLVMFFVFGDGKVNDFGFVIVFFGDDFQLMWVVGRFNDLNFIKVVLDVDGGIGGVFVVRFRGYLKRGQSDIVVFVFGELEDDVGGFISISVVFVDGSDDIGCFFFCFRLGVVQRLEDLS